MSIRSRLVLLACLCGLAFCSCGLFVEKLPNGEVPTPRPWDRFVEIGGIRYHFTEYPGPGKRVFLLHGFASSTYTWEKLAPLLQAEGCHVYALDMKGFGWSDKPRENVYDPWRLMEEVNRWMEVMGLEDVVFVGNSLGGAIAWNMAVDHADKVSALVLVDAAGFPHELPLAVRLADLPGAADLAELFFGRWIVHRMLEQVYHDASRVTRHQVDAYYDRLRTENALFALTALGKSLNRLAEEELTGRLRRVGVRTLVIWGAQDAWIPVENGRKFEEVIPGAALKIIPACGHVPQEEKPEETARLILDFLAQ